MYLNLDQLTQLIHIAEHANIEELEVSDSTHTIRIRCHSATHQILTQTQGQSTTASLSPQSAPLMVAPVLFSKSPQPFTDSNNPTKTPNNQPLNDKTANHGSIITSPMVGTFYRKSSPDSANFVEENSQVAIGDTLCIIEAMKIMHEVKAETAGVVQNILVNDGDMVEYDQPLLTIV